MRPARQPDDRRERRRLPEGRRSHDGAGRGVIHNLQHKKTPVNRPVSFLRFDLCLFRFFRIRASVCMAIRKRLDQYTYVDREHKTICCDRAIEPRKYSNVLLKNSKENIIIDQIAGIIDDIAKQPRDRIRQHGYDNQTSAFHKICPPLLIHCDFFASIFRYFSYYIIIFRDRNHYVEKFPS